MTTTHPPKDCSQPPAFADRIIDRTYEIVKPLFATNASQTADDRPQTTEEGLQGVVSGIGALSICGV